MPVGVSGPSRFGPAIVCMMRKKNGAHECAPYRMPVDRKTNGRHQVLRRGVFAQRPEGHNLTPPGSFGPKASQSTVRFVVRLTFPPDRPVRRPASPLDDLPEGLPPPNQVSRRSPRPVGRFARRRSSRGSVRPKARQPVGPLGPKAAWSCGYPARRPGIPEPDRPKTVPPGRPSRPEALGSADRGARRPGDPPTGCPKAADLGETCPKADLPSERRVRRPTLPADPGLESRPIRSAPGP